MNKHSAILNFTKVRLDKEPISNPAKNPSIVLFGDIDGNEFKNSVSDITTLGL